MKSLRTGALRLALVAAASLVTVLATGSAAQAHNISIFDGPGSGGLEANHTRIWVCLDAGSTPIWVTARFRDGTLRRYNGPAEPGFCRNHNVSNPTAIRLCWGNGQNTCTAFKDA
jgi:hypothetical protein